MEGENDTPNPQEQYQVVMHGDWILVPFSNRPDFNARQFWIDVASALNLSKTTDEERELFGRDFDKYSTESSSGDEIRLGSGIYAMFIRKDSKDGEEVKQIVVQNRNGRGNQEYNERMKSVVETALTPKPTNQAK